MSALRIVFMGTPELAAQSLRALLAAPDCEIVGVVTQPDQPKGRGLKLQPSPVKAVALDRALPVLQPERARDAAFHNHLLELRPELIAVAAYGQILPREILELPRFGCLNVHTSLLPKYRGAAPIQRAILNGDRETGVTIMKMDAGMDTGDIVAVEKTSIEPGETSQTLQERLAAIGAALLVKAIPHYVSGELQPRPQPSEGASYAPRIKKQDGRIDWTWPGERVARQIRAMTPWPGAFTHVPAKPEPILLKIWEAEPSDLTGAAGEVLLADKSGVVVGCGEGALRVQVLQREGGRRLTAREFLAGHPLFPGEKFC